MRVIIESPYKGDVARNMIYARRALKDSLNLGESPFAGHLLYTQVLSDEIPAERDRGIEAHLEWLAVADAVVVYKDYGITDGMKRAIRRARTLGKFTAYREIGLNP